MELNNILPVVLAGGSGTRLWPLSRKHYPKQFLSLNISEDTLLQATLKRISNLDTLPPVVICNEDHRFLTAEQLRTIGIENPKIILESIGKNTAPAIALSAFLAEKEHKDPLMIVLAADHYIDNHEAFVKTINIALPFAQRGKLVTLGIVPDKPEVGYGYIKKGQRIDTAYDVSCFVEKPDLEDATKYFESGNYLWNSGIFILKASRYLEELEKFEPEIYRICKNASESINIDHTFIRVDNNIFSHCPSNSIDYAVMEKTKDAIVIELDTQWSDIGSWAALWESANKDKNGNALLGDVINIKSENCYVHAKEKLVAVLGLENLVIIDTKDALLVANKINSQEIKKITEELESDNRSEHLNHRMVERPWGSYDSVDTGSRYQVKRITVKPGAKLSVQMHYHRAEHWIVVSGSALITNGNKTFILSENQSTYIPSGVVHSLENPGKIPLEIIEVQSGAYLGEDDIVRLEDKYGRT